MVFKCHVIKIVNKLLKYTTKLVIVKLNKYSWNKLEILNYIKVHYKCFNQVYNC